MADSLGINELIVNTITWDHTARLHSYDLLAKAFELESSSESVGQDILTTA
jgi:hypothetical protein